ncbi:MAG: hypothetical protein NE328_15315 [Lentisphaeraceae bacterium]|nr:hypothetical protein [Lentisphaeraceae bacterium]
MSTNQLSRTFEVLNLVAESKEGISYTEVGQACEGIAIATLARLLKSMVQENLLQKASSGKYYLGPSSISFAHKAVTLNSTEELIKPIIEKLAEISEQSAVYFELDGDAAKIVSKKEWPGSMFYRQIGARNERIFTHPSALTILAFEEENLVEFLLKAKKPKTDERNKFLALLEDIREKGFFLGNDPGYPCSRAIYPIFQKGVIKGSIGICVLGQNLDQNTLEKYSKIVKKHAALASDRLSLTKV